MAKKKKKRLLSGNAMTIFIILLMMGSGMGLMLGRNSPGGGGEYNGYSFVRDGSYWTTNYEGKTLKFRYLPTSLENMSLDENAVNTIRNSPGFLLTFNPESEKVQNLELARLQMERTFGNKLGKYIGSGVTKNVSGYEKLPVITCNNATRNTIVVNMQPANETGFEYENNCLNMNYRNPSSILMLKDRLIYGVTGIING